MTSAVVVSGIFDDYGVADKVKDDLEHSGIDEKQIFVFGSSQEAAETLRPQVHPAGTITVVEETVGIGGLLGAIFAFLVFHATPYHSQIFIGAFITFAGLGAGMYLGFLSGAIGKLDISEKHDAFTEDDMTKGKIFVAVETRAEDQVHISQKVMEDLGAIRITPEPEEPSETWLGKVATVVDITALLFMAAIVIMGSIAALQVTPVIGKSERVLLFICFIGLLAGSIATAYAGLHTKGARKWLSFEATEDVSDKV